MPLSELHTIQRGTIGQSWRCSVLTFATRKIPGRRQRQLKLRKLENGRPLFQRHDRKFKRRLPQSEDGLISELVSKSRKNTIWIFPTQTFNRLTFSPKVSRCAIL